MTQLKYFQKLKCNYTKSHPKICLCEGSGIIARADITETIKPILDGINNSKLPIPSKKSKLNDLYGESKSFNEGLEKAKQIIEENTIKVED